MTTPQPLLIAVMGPTASGKTALAERLAEELGAQLVNADAFQVYRGLDIGTAKPADRGRYRLLDLVDANEAFGLGEWLRHAEGELVRLFEERRHVVVVGGTGLYIRALFEEYSGMAGSPDPELRRELNETPIEELRERLVATAPELAAATDLANPVRVRRALERLVTPSLPPITLPSFQKVKFGILKPVDEVEGLIARRVHEMMHNGWIREIEGLRENGFCREDPGFRAIGYRILWDCIDRKIGLDEATATTIAETRRYAKRQRTWLRTEPGLVELLEMNERDALRKAMERIRYFLM